MRAQARTRAGSGRTNAGSRASARWSNCTSSRAARWRRWTPRSAWPKASGRTAGGGSTSPASPITPARPGWPTAATHAAVRQHRPGRPPGRSGKRRRGHVRQGRGRPQPHERGALGRPGLAGRPGSGRRSAGGHGRHGPFGPKIRPRAGGHARRQAGVVHPAGPVEQEAAGPDLRRAGRRPGSPRRCCPPGPGTTPVLAARVRPPCCSCATRRHLAFARRTCRAGRLRGRSPALAAVLEDLAGGSAPQAPGGTIPPRPPLAPALPGGGLPAPRDPPGRRWLAELAWLPGQGVRRRPHRSRRRATFSPSPLRPIRPAAVERLHRLTLPGFTNAHSHAFHRALRGRPGGPGDVRPGASGCTTSRPAWIRRYLRLARATYARWPWPGSAA